MNTFITVSWGDNKFLVNTAHIRVIESFADSTRITFSDGDSMHVKETQGALAKAIQSAAASVMHEYQAKLQILGPTPERLGEILSEQFKRHTDNWGSNS